MKRLWLTTVGIFFSLSAILGLSFLLAQPPQEGGGPPGEPGFPPFGFGPPMPVFPLMTALDVNSDGEIDAEELAKAPEHLKKLDKNQDGKLTSDEITPQFPFGPPGFGPPGGGPPGAGGPGGGPGFGGGPFGGPRGPGGMMGMERKIVSEYDKDGDGILNADERAAARKEIANNPERGPGGGPPGFGPPGFGPGGRQNQEPAKPGKKLSPKDVTKYDQQDLYDTSVLRTLFINFDAEDWERELEAFNNTDVEVPATLNVDGKQYKNVGVHFRGMSSYGMVPRSYKRSLNLTMDFMEKDQRLYDYKTLNLLNAHEDHSFMSSVLYSHLANKVISAPKANFVRVVINGENWGIYANVQQFNRDFLAENYGSTQGTRWKVGGNPGADGGLRYTGEEVEQYRRRYAIKSQDKPEAWQDLIKLCKTIDQTPVDQLEAALAPMLDIDETLWFLALDCALINNDGYWVRSSDYSIYQDENKKFHLIPHDMNEAFHGMMGPPGFGRGGPGGGPGGPGAGPGGFGGPGGPRGPQEPSQNRRPGEGNNTADSQPPQGLNAGGPGGGPQRQGGPGFGPGGPGGPGGFGGGPRGMGGMGGGGVNVDPLVGINEARTPLRSKLLQVPALRAKYLDRVRTIAEKGLDWNAMAPTIQAWRSLIEKDIEDDTKKLSTYESFVSATSSDAGSSTGGREMSLRSFFDQRREFLLKNKDVSEAKTIEMQRPRTPVKPAPKLTVSLDRKKKPSKNTPRIVINEVLASNTRTIKDPQGEFHDWIELYNPTNSDVSLDGMYITDSDRAPRKWAIPNGTVVRSKGYLLIWADEHGKAEEGLHANFKLSSKGEDVFLVDSDERGNSVVDHVRFEKQTDDVSYGRDPKNPEQWTPLTPTPGMANQLNEG